jgi:hypothetical protein
MQQDDLERMEHFLEKILLPDKQIFTEKSQDTKIYLKENSINN